MIHQYFGSGCTSWNTPPAFSFAALGSRARQTMRQKPRPRCPRQRTSRRRQIFRPRDAPPRNPARCAGFAPWHRSKKLCSRGFRSGLPPAGSVRRGGSSSRKTRGSALFSCRSAQNGNRRSGQRRTFPAKIGEFDRCRAGGPICPAPGIRSTSGSRS